MRKGKMRKRSLFSLSHFKDLTFDCGELIPVTWMEVLPGDTIQHKVNALVRMPELDFPVMHPLEIHTAHWYVPFNQVWDDYEDFFLGGADGTAAPTHPVTALGSAAISAGDLAEYLGVAIGGAVSPSVNALPFRVYNHIANQYINHDIQTETAFATASGVDATTPYAVRQVNWEGDYFTTCKPWEQKGADIGIPISPDATTVAPVFYTGPTTGQTKLYASSASSDALWHQAASANTDAYWADPHLEAALSGLRESEATQHFLENRALHGHRYSDYLRFLGIGPDDLTLDRPLYLGGGKNMIQFSEVLQQGVTTSGSADGVGRQAGHAIAALRSNRYRKFFKHHGIIMTMMYVRPKTVYFEGLEKRWRRSTKFDYYTHELAQIGQDEVYNYEIYRAHSAPSDVFGYQNRYDDWRRMESRVHGEFCSAPLHGMHMARAMGGDPTLNSAFLTCSPTNRIYQDTTVNQLRAFVRHSIQARRMVHRDGRPALV